MVGATVDGSEAMEGAAGVGDKGQGGLDGATEGGVAGGADDGNGEHGGKGGTITRGGDDGGFEAAAGAAALCRAT